MGPKLAKAYEKFTSDYPDPKKYPWKTNFLAKAAFWFFILFIAILVVLNITIDLIPHDKLDSVANYIAIIMAATIILTFLFSRSHSKKTSGLLKGDDAFSYAPLATYAVSNKLTNHTFDETTWTFMVACSIAAADIKAKLEKGEGTIASSDMLDQCKD